MIYMIGTEHCPKCENALKTLQAHNCDLSEDNFMKLTIPQDQLGIDIATELGASMAPVFAKDATDGSHVQITLEEAIQELS